MKVELRIEPDAPEPFAIICVPKLTDDIQAAVELLENTSASHGMLTGKQNGRTFVLDPAQVELVRTEGRTLQICTSEGTSYEADGPLHKLHEMLGGDFLRISKSSLVNIRRIDHFFSCFNGNMALVTKSGVEDYISRIYLKIFKARMGL